MDLSAFGASWIFLAKSQLAFAQGNYLEAISIADKMIDYMRQFKLNQFLADLLLLNGKAHWALGERDQARQALDQARQAAEALGSRRMMWQILGALAEVETDSAQAGEFRIQAQAIVQDIANHTPPELRQGFLAMQVVGI